MELALIKYQLAWLPDGNEQEAKSCVWPLTPAVSTWMHTKCMFALRGLCGDTKPWCVGKGGILERWLPSWLLGSHNGSGVPSKLSFEVRGVTCSWKQRSSMWRIRHWIKLGNERMLCGKGGDFAVHWATPQEVLLKSSARGVICPIGQLTPSHGFQSVK